MEATSITQLLKGFCDHTQWKYAVFWKLDHHFPMTLAWENGYQKKDAEKSTWGDINFQSSNELHSSSGENTDYSGDYSAQLLMIEMSHRKYSLGEGVVGKIALARDHLWVSCDDILTSKFDTDLIPECPDEWILQFACGIKTIVLVPVLSLGVLQFGSVEAVAEDLEFVTNIKEKFHSIQCLEANATPLNLGTDYQDWSFSDLMHNLMDSLDDSSSVTKCVLKSEVSTSTAALNYQDDDGCLSRENILKSLKRKNENEIGSSSIDMSTVARHICKVETKPNHMEEEIWSWSHLANNVGVFGEMSNRLEYFSAKNLAKKQFGGTETSDDDTKNVSDFTFPSQSELHKALGSVSYGETGKSMSKYVSVEDTYSTQTLVTNKREHDHFKGFEFPNDIDPEYLLDAIVGNLCSASDDTSSISDSVRSLTTIQTVFSGSIQLKDNSEEKTLVVDKSDVKNDFVPAVMVKGKDEFSTHFTSSFDGNASLLIEARLENATSHIQPNCGPKHSGTGKRRTKGGNNPKSRPRDRQLIMDRMKELRELVPDGGRCSIDNLLERTIKHMLYLRKITNQAEKLKRFANQVVPECKRQKINGSQPGRSCAFDFESELAWPIVIEDLECSGHMLIEMICNEHGLFLEIAQVIRKLDVTILKGILENRSSNNWACFIVEVPRGFHRMDVLCPLLHLLQLRRNPCLM
ncbi:transcription factor LHW isoform X1 [Cajanus cajan]|uniref:transcription factor LHW isoform X1 n=1 Tax=Cajanus cajan TaxID=3821 RepID=UPI00098DA6F4|nr:transcription factor LHW isoform X1 [Cajanus cajan]